MDLEDDFGRLAAAGSALRKFYGGIRPWDVAMTP
jgi:hypothetical protein